MKTVVTKALDDTLLMQWLSLWRKSPYANYTNSPQWFSSVTETFGFSEYVCIAIYEEDSLVAIGALIKRDKYNTTIYTVEPGDFACGLPFLIDITNKKVVKIFVKELLALGVVLLDNVSEDFVSIIGKTTQKLDTIPQAPNYFLPIIKDKDGKAQIANRKILMHRVRDIESHFVLRIFDGTTDEGLETAIAIDSKSRKESAGYNTFSTEETKDFFRSLAKHFQKNIIFNILYFDDIPIAFEIGFVAGKTYFGNQISIHADYVQYSPGKVLIAHLLDSLAARNFKKMDLGSGEAHIKRLITQDHRQLYHVILSGSKLTINYIKSRKYVKNYAYNSLQSHTNIYTVYRKLKKLRQ